MSGYTGGLVVSGGISLIDRLDIMENVNRIVAEGIAAVEAAQDFNALEQIKARYLGKTGELTGLLKTLGQMSPEERKTIGAHINECKNRFQTAFNAKRDALNEAKLQARLAAEALDITLARTRSGRRQPASRNPDLATCGRTLSRNGFRSGGRA